MSDRNVLVGSDQIAAFLKFIREAPSKCEMARQDEEEANLETQDILHALEIHNHPYNKKAKLAGKLSEARRRRRAAKDVTDVHAPVVEWAEENRVVLKSLERLLGEVRKAESLQKNRCYVNRTTVLEEME